MVKILFIGYYGHRNTGDDAFCVVANWGSRMFWGENDIAFLASELPTMNPKPRLIYASKQRFKGHYWLQSIKAALNADKIIFFGGSLFHQRDKLLGIKNIICNIPNFSKKQVLGLGISLGPFKNTAAYKYNQNILGNFSLLTLRDKESYNIAETMKLEAKIVEAADPALLLPDALADSIKEEQSCEQENSPPVLGVSLCHYERYVQGDLSREARRETSIIEALKSLNEKIDLRFRFFIFNGHPIYGDDAVTAKAIKLIKPKWHEIIPYTSDIVNIMRRMRGCSAFLGVRFHSIVFSYILKIPFLSVEYHRKCSDFLKDIGFVEDLRINDDKVNIENKLFDILQKRKFSIPDKRDILKERALRNFLYI